MSRKLASCRFRILPAGMSGLVFLICLAAGPAAFSADDSFKRLRIGPAPAGTAAAPFEMPTLDGRRVASHDLAGKVVVLNFWATWCGPCKDEMPALDRLRKSLDPDTFALLTITTDLQREGIGHFLRQLDVHLPVLFDEDQEVSRAYMVRALPTTIIINRDGTLLGRAVGPREWDSPDAVALMRRFMERQE
ncbi:MAG: TlpA disulfide reductase family protein [Nitrospiraceae bacterium]